MDIAVDPLEGTTLTAKGGPNAMAVVALAEHGNFLHAPDIYMDKIAVGGGLPDGRRRSRRARSAKNLRNLARAKKCDVSRPGRLHPGPRPARGADRQTREAGARIMLISDGDVAGVIATAQPESGVDIYHGLRRRAGGRAGGGGAALHRRADAGAAAVRGRGADRSARGRWASPTPTMIYAIEEMAKGDVMFAATGVTSGRDAARRAPVRPAAR